MKVLLYTDQPIADVGFRQVFAGSYEVLGQCSVIEDIVAKILLEKPELVVVDLTRAVTVGLLRDLVAASQAPVMLWIEEITPEFSFQAFHAGVKGIVRKDFPIAQQKAAVAMVARGEMFFDNDTTQNFLTMPYKRMTGREAQLVALIASGMKNKEVAQELHIAEGTVKVYLSRLFQKLGCKDRYQLALFGRSNLGPNPKLQVDGAPRHIVIPRPRM